MNLFYRIIAALVLMAYAITGTSLVPALELVLAEFDGRHEVLIRESAGGTQIVLHHRAGEFTPCVADHEYGVTRVLVSLCSSDQEGDHNINSARVSSTTRLDVTPSISHSVALNVEATHALILSLKRSARGMIRVPVISKEFWISHQPTLLSTTQLLI